MKNLDALELSVANSKMNFDFSNPMGTLVIPKEKGKDNRLTAANKKVLELITTYKTVKDDSDVPEEYKEKIIYSIMEILDTVDNINYSSFCIYFQVLRFSHDSFENARKKKLLTNSERAELLKNAVELYIENRHDIYSSHGYSDMALQVRCDCGSSRRSRSIGSNSLKNIMDNFNINQVYSYDDFMKGNSFFFPEDLKNLLIEVIEKNSIDFKFRETHDGKYPDLMFKIGNQFYILEHKLATGRGGAQNSEINEIITFIGQEESNINVHYISCLQGDMLNTIFDSNPDPKTKTQHDNIINHLKDNSNNYFLNEFGLNELLKILVH